MSSAHVTRSFVTSISFILLVSIAITTVASIWIVGLTNDLCKSELLEVSYVYALPSSNSSWKLEIMLVNTGFKNATIKLITINGIPLEEISLEKYNLSLIELPAGHKLKLTLNVKSEVNGKKLAHGAIIQIAFYTSSGKLFFSSVSLP